MSNKMLIDASLPEETRLVVTKGNRIEEFDFESQNRKMLRGNIYLAKVVRVEPSLQAAFVEYGGNRHGFLSFSEIHPDYYQIPVADREALIRESIEEERIESNEELVSGDESAGLRNSSDSVLKEAESDSGAPALVSAEEMGNFGDAGEIAPEDSNSSTDDSPLVSGSQEAAIETFEENGEVGEAGENAPKDSDFPSDDSSSDTEPEINVSEEIESTGGGDALEEVPVRRLRQRKQYKIQDVIKRHQILLLQVLKDERGSKGASMTTYISLAGRFSVLMPNTARGGGISRKIVSIADRKRLKQIASGLEIPEGMGVIIRTAGASRTKAEITRDFENLIRIWEQIRDLTMKSSAPCMIYEEGSLIKRSIRDLYSKDISQIVVSGEEGYQTAKEFMGMLMPSHVKHVQKYRGKSPIFSKNDIEGQIESMFSPDVILKSGGSIVINQTEALVAIDVNSGKSTREHNIESTATLTNLEACEEIARQLRLRDLAGLIVIDFIDMDDRKNNKKVEKRLKECLSTDRARIQIGRVSHFGLLEMSRQRLRTGLFESSTVSCPHCFGTGKLRSNETVAVQALREIETVLMKNASRNLKLTANTGVLLGIMNQNRRRLTELEQQFGVEIQFDADETLLSGQYSLTREEMSSRKDEGSKKPSTIKPDTVVEHSAEDDTGEEGAKKKKRRRRKKRTQEFESTESAVASNGNQKGEQPPTDSQQNSEVENQNAETENQSAETGKPNADGRKRKGLFRRRRSSSAAKTNGDNAPDSVNSPDKGSESAPQPKNIPAEPVKVPITTPDPVDGSKVAESVNQMTESESDIKKEGEAAELEEPVQSTDIEADSTEKKGGWWNLSSKN